MGGLKYALHPKDEYVEAVPFEEEDDTSAAVRINQITVIAAITKIITIR